jgi:hypothetical protein
MWGSEKHTQSTKKGTEERLKKVKKREKKPKPKSNEGEWDSTYEDESKSYESGSDSDSDDSDAAKTKKRAKQRRKGAELCTTSRGFAQGLRWTGQALSRLFVEAKQHFQPFR